MTEQLTEHQHAAITTRKVSVALSAGAGCGKTFVLTRRFLSHLEPGGDAAKLGSLVAITFTDRAAREMRDRIRAACRERLQNCPEQEVAHWLRILYDLDSARITTIHSFCTSLLRAHAVEAGLDPRFTVADAAQTAALIRRSARDTLHKLLEEHNDDAHLVVLHFGLERSQELLADLVSQRFRDTSGQLGTITAEACAANWPKLWRETCVPLWMENLLAAGICRETRGWLKDREPKKGSVMFDRRQSVLALLSTPPAPADFSHWLQELRETAKVQSGGGKSVWTDPADHEEITRIFKDLRDAVDCCAEKAAYQSNDVAFAAELTASLSRLGVRAIANYEQLKHQQGQLDFDDLLLRARNLLRDFPEVAKRLAAGITLLMVDEFQDTDLVQADMIRRLTGPALKTGKLFLVGDKKQSIYRFRRAEPALFDRLREEIPKAGRLPLHVNFRSQPEILNFVNHLFAGNLGDNYEKLIPFPDEQRTPPPTIEFLWATRDRTPPANPSNKPSAEELRLREADWIAARISELLADDRPTIRDENCPGELRRAQPGDIAILFRTLSDASLYEGALAKSGIAYYLVGGKTFYAQQEVFDLLNLCRWLDDPADEIPLIGVLRSPLFNLSDDAIYALKLSCDLLGAALEHAPPEWLTEPDRRRIRFAGRVLSELRQLKDRLPPSELLRTAVDRTGYDAALLHEYLGSRKVANLDKLLRRAAEFDDAEHFTLSDYVRELEQAVEDQTDESFAATLPEAGEVVRLMTVHQSKGLEFPVVIVADMNRHGHSRSGGIVLHEEWGALVKPPDDFGTPRENLGLRIHQALEEQADADEIKRLLYVATTRAADRLILSAGMTPDLKPESPWMKLLSERFDLRTGLLKNDALLGSQTGAGADRQRVPNVCVHPDPPPRCSEPEPESRQVKLALLAESVLNSESNEFPETAAIYRPAIDWHGMLSVSSLEELAGGQHPTRISAADDDSDDDRPRSVADVLGTVVHGVLQMLNFRDPSTWQALVDECVRKQPLAPFGQATVREDARPLIERLVASPLAARFAAANGLHREIDFVLSWPPDGPISRAMLTGQIDVLLHDERGWHLFDYKTGNFPATTSDADLLAPYALQLGVYAIAAERYLNEPLVSIGLIALRPAVRMLPFPWSDKARLRIVQEVDAILAKGI